MITCKFSKLISKHPDSKSLMPFAPVKLLMTLPAKVWNSFFLYSTRSYWTNYWQKISAAQNGSTNRAATKPFNTFHDGAWWCHLGAYPQYSEFICRWQVKSLLDLRFSPELLQRILRLRLEEVRTLLLGASCLGHPFESEGSRINQWRNHCLSEIWEHCSVATCCFFLTQCFYEMLRFSLSLQ